MSLEGLSTTPMRLWVHRESELYRPLDRLSLVDWLETVRGEEPSFAYA